MNFYTGLPNLKILKAIFDHVCVTLPSEKALLCKLTKFQEFMLVMIKMRLDSPVVDLAYRFGVSPATVSRILLKWLTQMDIRLRSLIIWPERDDLQKTMPKYFQLSFGKKVAIIIECFEIFWKDHQIYKPEHLLGPTINIQSVAWNCTPKRHCLCV